MYRKSPILLLEDNEIEGKRIQNMYAKLDQGGTLRVCEDGVAGLTWLEHHQQNLPWMILLDLNMPKMDGITFLTEIKKHERYKYIPVIAFTNSKDPKDIERCFQQNIAGYMVKPFQNKEFFNTIKRINSYWEKCELPY